MDAYKHLEVVQELRDRGADVNVSDQVRMFVDMFFLTVMVRRCGFRFGSLHVRHGWVLHKLHRSRRLAAMHLTLTGENEWGGVSQHTGESACM